MNVYPFLNMDAMDAHRKKRLEQLLAGAPFFNDRTEFMKAVGLSKGRITQLLDPEDAFGERSARTIEKKLRLETRWFDKGMLADAAAWPFATITPEQFYSLGEDVRRAAEAGLAAVLRSGEMATAQAKRKATKNAA